MSIDETKNTISLKDETSIKDLKLCDEDKNLLRELHSLIKPESNISNNKDDNETESKHAEELKIISLFDDKSERPSIFSFGEKPRVNSYIGVLHYKNKTIHIKSRFDSGEKQYFLNYIFEKTFGLKDRVFPDMSPSAGPGETFDILLIYVFINNLNIAMKSGLYRKYQNFEYNDSKFKGKLDVSRHIKYNMIDNGKIAYSTREYTVNNSINHLILLANDFLAKKYSTAYKTLLNVFPPVKAHIKNLKDTIPDYKAMDPKSVLKKTSKAITHPYYHRYENLRKVSIQVLRRFGFNVFDEKNEVTGIVIYMPALWEKFIEETIMKDIKDFEIVTQDKRVVLEGRRTIEPDFSIKKDGKYIAIFDAKYRETWGYNIFKEANGNWDNGVRSDVFQVFAYMLSFNTSIGGVLFPMKYKDSMIYNDPVREKDSMSIRGLKVSDLCHDRKFYIIPFVIPDYEDMDYKEFYDYMDKQVNSISKELKNILKENAKNFSNKNSND